MLKTNPFHMVADWAAGQMWHCCGNDVCERRDRGGDKVIQRSVSQDGRAGGKPHPPHSSSIKTGEEEDAIETNLHGITKASLAAFVAKFSIHFSLGCCWLFTVAYVCIMQKKI